MEEYHGTFGSPYRREEKTQSWGDLDEEDPGVLCGFLAPYPAGYFICFLVASEGCFVLAGVLAYEEHAPHLIVGLDTAHPFHRLQQVLISALGFVDTFACMVGVVGLYFTRNVAPAILTATLGISQVMMSTLCIAFVLVWRALLAGLVAPWLGFMMAFEPSQEQESLQAVLGVTYIALNVYLVWVLASVVMAVLRQTMDSEEQIRQRDAQERYERLQLAHTMGYPDVNDMPPSVGMNQVLLGCFPLEITVTTYIVLMCVLCFWWLLKLIFLGHSSGGWAFLTTTPHVSVTFWLEIFIYLLSVTFSVLALSAMVLRNQRVGVQDGMEAMRVQKRCTIIMLIYLIISILRFAFFIPITGMVLVAQDICGLYVRGMSELGIASYANVPVHCSLGELTNLAIIAGTILWDGYLLCGVLWLWEAYRTEYQFHGFTAAKGYGAAEPPAA